MRFSKIISRRIRAAADGVDVVGDVNAAISANVNEPGRTVTRVSSRQSVIHRSGDRTHAETQRGEPDDAPRAS